MASFESLKSSRGWDAYLFLWVRQAARLLRSGARSTRTTTASLTLECRATLFSRQLSMMMEPDQEDLSSKLLVVCSNGARAPTLVNSLLQADGGGHGPARKRREVLIAKT